jgi:hypothetical protein
MKSIAKHAGLVVLALGFALLESVPAAGDPQPAQNDGCLAERFHVTIVSHVHEKFRINAVSERDPNGSTKETWDYDLTLHGTYVRELRNGKLRWVSRTVDWSGKQSSWIEGCESSKYDADGHLDLGPTDDDVEKMTPEERGKLKWNLLSKTTGPASCFLFAGGCGYPLQFPNVIAFGNKLRKCGDAASGPSCRNYYNNKDVDRCGTRYSETVEQTDKPWVHISQVDTPSNDGKTPNCSKSFVSKDTITIHATKVCSNGLKWTSDNTAANGSLTPKTSNAEQYAAKPSPPAAPSTRNASLTYAVKISAGSAQDHTTIVQDDIDKIRQQYIDMNKWKTPDRSAFIDSGQSSGGHFTFAQIQSKDGAPWAVFSIFEDLETWRTNYGQNLPPGETPSMTLNRGYTTPKHNATIQPPGATNSNHIYGTAADVASTQVTWGPLKQAAKDAGACTEPASLSYPGHVHADWRGGCPGGW